MATRDKMAALLTSRLESTPSESGDDVVFELAGDMRLYLRRVPGVDWSVAWIPLAASKPADDKEAEAVMRQVLGLGLARLYRAHDLVLSRDEDNGAPILFVKLDEDDDAKCLEKITRLLNEAETVSKRLGASSPSASISATSVASLFSGMQGMMIRP